MSFSKKSTFPLFESLALENGQIKNLNWHQWRFEQSYRALYGNPPPYLLSSALRGIHFPPAGQRYKLRIRYGRYRTQTQILAYTPKHPKTLQLVEIQDWSYPIKWSDREPLQACFEKREGADDILLHQNRVIRDSSYANIAFVKEGRWFTPDTPLLPGTKRAKLLSEGLLTERRITLSDLKEYEGFQLINALLVFDPDFAHPIEQIWGAD